MKKLSYYLSIFASLLCVGLPCGGLYYWLTHITNPNYVIVCALGGWLLFLPLVKKWRQDSRYAATADVFGRMNSFEYKEMSAQERKEFDKQRTMEMERVLSQSAVKKATHPGPKEPEEALKKLIGMNPVKQKTKEIVARAIFDKSNTKEPFRGHFVFYGNPGTGKTTVARILTSFLYNNKCIKENKCIEVDGNTLKGGAPGESALKVEILVKNAFGGVLFIDEAYAMAEGGGKEAVDTLIKYMEDYRDKFVLIMAGYTIPMKKLLDMNPGFTSRINDYVDFPDYSPTEAKDILRVMAGEKNMVIEDAAYEVFEGKYVQEMKKKDFGNARTVRNILETAVTKHALRVMEKSIEKADTYRLLAEDFR